MNAIFVVLLLSASSARAQSALPPMPDVSTLLQNAREASERMHPSGIEGSPVAPDWRPDATTRWPSAVMTLEGVPDEPMKAGEKATLRGRYTALEDIDVPNDLGDWAVRLVRGPEPVRTIPITPAANPVPTKLAAGDVFEFTVEIESDRIKLYAYGGQTLTLRAPFGLTPAYVEAPNAPQLSVEESPAERARWTRATTIEDGTTGMRFVSGELVVAFEPAVDVEAWAAKKGFRIGGVIMDEPGYPPIVKILVPADKGTRDYRDEVAKDPAVRIATVNTVLYPH
ncbi:MAG: hypothetical protein HYZ75_05755 [Elusimicrobia bacterium]|nr:hypothetical protein [Elusimicrobiota bacterium]